MGLFYFWFGMDPVQLTSRICYLPASPDPLSADVIAVRGDGAWWIFDVGSCDGAVEFINGLDLSLRKNIVISHFHADHMENLVRALHGEIEMYYDNLYVGAYTYRHAKSGTVVVQPLEFEDGARIKILPVPSSHAKGSLALIVDDEYAFLGDSTYPTVGHGEADSYNVQLLYEQIKFISSLPMDSLYLSHKKGLRRERESVLSVLKSVYDRRGKNENRIYMTRGPGQ